MLCFLLFCSFKLEYFYCLVFSVVIKVGSGTWLPLIPRIFCNNVSAYQQGLGFAGGIMQEQIWDWDGLCLVPFGECRGAESPCLCSGLLFLKHL